MKLPKSANYRRTVPLRSNEIVSSLGHDRVNIVNIRLWLSLIDSISQKTQPWPIYFFQCSWNFRKDWISKFNIVCVLLVGDYLIWSLLTFRESLLPVINTYQFNIHSCMNIVNVTVRRKTVISSAKWIKRIWFEDLCMSLIYNRSTGPNT